MKCFFLSIAILINCNIYAFSFSALFPHSHAKIVAKSSDYTNVHAKEDFAKYCTKKLVPYGVQIHCIREDEPKTFRFNASATVKCRQKVIGVSNDYPDGIDLPIGFIKQLKLCHGGKIVGPNILHMTNVSESSSLGAQKNQTDTFYDVICHDDQNYSKAMYKAKQSRYSALTSVKLNQCKHDTDTTNSSVKYILIFRILLGLVVFSFLLRFYFKYRAGINRFFAKLLHK